MENIILVGMPGAGKSTIGVVLAKMMGWQFIDSDLLIQAEEGRLLCDIIEQEGIDGFLQIEDRVNASIHTNRAIIATGGSAIYCEHAMEHFRKIGKVVYLRMGFEELKERLGDLEKRGVVLKNGQTLLDLYNERTPLYEKYADITVDNPGYGIEKNARAILSAYR